MGIWPASYVVTAEVSSLRLRAKTQGIAWALASIANFLFSFVSPYMYNTDAGNLRSKVGFVWCAICALTFLGSWFYIPEMFGRSTLQLDLMFEGKVATNKFGSLTNDELLVIATTTSAGREQYPVA